MSRTSMGRMPEKTVEEALAERKEGRKHIYPKRRKSIHGNYKCTKHYAKFSTGNRKGYKGRYNAAMTRRYTSTVYAVSLCKCNQSGFHTRTLDKLVSRSVKYFYTVAGDYIVVCFVRPQSAEKFYITARQNGFRPNLPIQFYWRKKFKGERGEFVSEEKFAEYQTQRMSRTTYQQRRDGNIHKTLC